MTSGGVLLLCVAAWSSAGWALPPRYEEGGPAWDESNFEAALDPANRVGTDPSSGRLPATLAQTSVSALRSGVGADPAHEQITRIGNGNFKLTVPVMRLPGRGLDLVLDLTYNSRVWTKQRNQTMVFDAHANWPALGWSLGFGKLVTIGSAAKQSMLVEPDSSPHSFEQQGSWVSSDHKLRRYYHRTTDGSFIDYEHELREESFIDDEGHVVRHERLSAGQAKYPNGLVVHFSACHPAILVCYPDQVRDENGNYIRIKYRNGMGPSIDTITDTLGRTILFHYDEADRLTAITGPGLSGGTRTLVRFHYRDLALNPAFAGLTTRARAATVRVLDSIYFPGSDNGYWFGDSDAYSDYGMLRKVSERRGMSLAASSLTEQGTVTAGELSRERVYDYQLGADPMLTAAPEYTTVTETWEGIDAAPGSRLCDPDRRCAVTTYHIKTNENPREAEVTRPDGTRMVELSFNEPGSFLDGLPFLMETYDAKGTRLQQKRMVWEQGAYKSPRLAHVEVIDEKVTDSGRRQWTATGFSYGPEYNRVEEVREYDYDGEFVDLGGRMVYDATVLRRVHTEYETDPHYADDRHIFYLPKVVEVYEGESALRSRTEYTYDGLSLADAPGIVAQDLQWLQKYRGNLTEVRTYADAANRSGAIVKTLRYDVAGNLRTVWGSSCCEQESFDYEIETQYAYPTAHKRGAISPASPARMTTTARYDFNTGLLLETSDANGRKTEYHYDAETLRLRSVGWPTTDRQPYSPLTTYDYNDATLATTETTRSGTAQQSTTHANRVMRHNGLGLVVREERLAEGGAWNVVETQYDVLGRLWKNTRPFRKAEDPRNEIKYWTEYSYDALGRVTTVRAPDGSQERRAYDTGDIGHWLGASSNSVSKRPAPGRTVLVQDPNGREKWTRLDALGRLAEVADPDPDSTFGSLTSGIPSFVDYDFDALDNVVAVNRLVFGWEKLWVSCITISALCEHGQVVGVDPADPPSEGEVSGSGLTDPRRPPGAEDSPGLGGGDSEDLPSISDGVWGLKATMLYGDFAYDSLGRLTRQRLAGKDNTLNIAGDLWSDAFTYHSRSNLTSHTDARGVKSIYDYGGDPLNRLQTVTYDTSGVSDANSPVLPAASIRYEYMSTGDLTRLWRVTVDGIASEEYGYDGEGRLEKRTLTLASRHAHPLVTEYTYDLLDRVTDTRYPAAYGIPGEPRKLVHYDFSVGRLTGLTLDGAAYAAVIARNTAGQTTSLMVGKSGPQSVTEVYGYDSETGLLESQQVQRAGTSLLDLSYLHGDRGSINGQLKGIIDNLDGWRSRQFRYDAVGRLQSVTGGDQQWHQRYTYHRFGGRTGVTAAGATADGTPIPRDGLSEVIIGDESQRILHPSGFAYDAAGNLTRGLGPDGNWQRYQYDAAGRLAKVLNDDGSTLEAYTYGADRRRLATQHGDTPGERAYYAWSGNAVIAEYEETAASMPEPRWTKSYIYLGGRLLATLAPGAVGEVVRYHHVDRTGTRRLVTEPADRTVAEQVTLPYGTFLPAESTEATNPLFTSYDRSWVTGVDYAVNRYYDFQQGRFLQPEPLGLGAADFGDPQSLNLYAYVRNDPVNATDPLGLYPNCFRPEGGDPGTQICVEINPEYETVVIGHRDRLGARDVVRAHSGRPVSWPGGGRVELIARQMEIRNEAFQEAFRELQSSLTNPLMWIPMFTPGMGTKGIEIGWGLLFDLALTADDFNDWIGPFFRMQQRVAGSEAEALQWLQAARQATTDRANYRLLTESLNQKLGLYWAWQDRPQSAPQGNQYEDLTRKLNRAGLYWLWQTSP